MLIKVWDEITYPFLNLSLGMDKLFHPTFYWSFDYLYMLGLKLKYILVKGQLASEWWRVAVQGVNPLWIWTLHDDDQIRLMLWYTWTQEVVGPAALTHGMPGILYLSLVVLLSWQQATKCCIILSYIERISWTLYVLCGGGVSLIETKWPTYSPMESIIIVSAYSLSVTLMLNFW